MIDTKNAKGGGYAVLLIFAPIFLDFHNCRLQTADFRTVEMWDKRLGLGLGLGLGLKG